MSRRPVVAQARVLRRVRAGERVRYGTEAAAQLVAARMVKTKGEPDDTLRAYYCPRCAGWHVGHDKRWRK